MRGGSFAFLSSYTAATYRDACATNGEVVNDGFRVAAAVPEPGLAAGLVATSTFLA